ncbi:MAG: hypothetical protein GY824_32880, partial [Delftia sp.]|nr:hypothetical protein [Delftia sp.]
EVHTLWAVVILYAITWPLTLLASELAPFQQALVIGYVSHLLLDMLPQRGSP